MPSRRAVRMTRQAISPRFAMSSDRITGVPRGAGARGRWRASARRPPIAPNGPAPDAAGDRQRGGTAGAVARLVADRPAGAADGHADAAAASAAAFRQSAELLIADPANGAPGAGAKHEIMADRVDERAAPDIE